MKFQLWSHTFTPAREVDDAVLMLARFCEWKRWAASRPRALRSACRNRNYLEIHGAKGAIPVRFGGSQPSAPVFNADDATEVQGSS